VSGTSWPSTRGCAATCLASAAELREGSARRLVDCTSLTLDDLQETARARCATGSSPATGCRAPATVAGCARDECCRRCRWPAAGANRRRRHPGGNLPGAPVDEQAPRPTRQPATGRARTPTANAVAAGSGDHHAPSVPLSRARPAVRELMGYPAERNARWSAGPHRHPPRQHGTRRQRAAAPQRLYGTVHRAGAARLRRTLTTSALILVEATRSRS